MKGFTCHNAEVPQTESGLTYPIRVGRTGRISGLNGLPYTLYSPADDERLTQIEPSYRCFFQTTTEIKMVILLLNCRTCMNRNRRTKRPKNLEKN